jgi:hypothetical protein
MVIVIQSGILACRLPLLAFRLQDGRQFVAFHGLAGEHLDRQRVLAQPADEVLEEACVAFHGLQGKAQQLRDQRVMSSARRRANENRLAPSLA